MCRLDRAVLAGVLVSLLLGACSSAPPSGPDSVARSAAPATAAPSVPEGWQVLDDETGRMRVALPPTFARIEGMEGVVAQQVTEPGVFTAEVWSTRVRDVQPEPPLTQEVVAAWLEDQLRSWAGPNFDPTGVRRVDLPAGEAIEIRGQIRSDFALIEVLAYGIPSAEGIADLWIFAVPEAWDEDGSELELIPLLFELRAP